MLEKGKSKGTSVHLFLCTLSFLCRAVSAASWQKVLHNSVANQQNWYLFYLIADKKSKMK